jgi:outer membrane murein-binding lipoprotein Lpp
MNKKQMKTLKETIDQLEDKVNAVKEQLQLPLSTMKKNAKTFIHFDDAA